jgi:hypothetical protein
VQQATFDVRGDILIRRTIWFDRVTGHGSSSLHVCLACKGLCRGPVYLEVLLHNVEDGAIVEVVDTNEITHLLLPLDSLCALSCHKDTDETALVNVGPLLPNALARVEESCHAGAYGSNSAGVGGLYHRPNDGIAKSLVWYLRVPTVGSGNTTHNSLF